MKTIAYTALHYGTDYLYYAIRSVIDYVDEYHVLYSANGSHGHRTAMPNPDTRHALYREALRGAGDKLRWHDGDWTHEGQQRDDIHRIVPDADVVIVLDADEIWPKPLIEAAIQPEKIERIRVPIIHFWRSFHKAVLHDPAYPERVIYPYGCPGILTLDTPFRIAHMGYAQRSEIVRYKLETHGHRNEFRRDCDWFADKFMANAQIDCHPVGSEYWNPETVDPLDYMPAWMQEHPYFGLAVIP